MVNNIINHILKNAYLIGNIHDAIINHVINKRVTTFFIYCFSNSSRPVAPPTELRPERGPRPRGGATRGYM